MQIDRRELIRAATAAGGALALAASLAAITSAQDAPASDSSHQGHHQMESDEATKSDTTGGKCHEMMEARQHMMSDMESTKATLDDLVAKMDTAAGDARFDAMAKVVHELVAERHQMAAIVARTQPRMMARMMSHMQGGMAGMKTAMPDCPAMKAMMEPEQGAESGSPGSHSH